MRSESWRSDVFKVPKNQFVGGKPHKTAQNGLSEENSMWKENGENPTEKGTELAMMILKSEKLTIAPRLT
ncbi:hypothetical protein Y032_0560g3474 [Ancylostoma ceylanicum]|uniref:Uncharacterized protein n=1 Tax=Ancylostoma ceylanicum TaxID=53326 RepID=A0A016WRP5_9BILA|nr:hypothetical protein Y032_0560g3474 [Ancylostoma ceylanicum]